MGLFNQDSGVERIGENRWRASLTENWCVGPVPNGGYVMAIMGKALSEALEHPHPLSINAFYLAPSQVGECEVEVELLRQGGSTSFAMARLFQNNELKVQATAAFVDFESARGESQILLEPPQVPTFADCAELPINDFITITKHTTQKVIPGQEKSMMGQPQGGGEWAGWIDFSDGNPVDVFSLLYFSDAFPPPAFTLYGPTGWVPTLDLSVQLRGIPAQGPMKCRFTSKTLSAGTMEEDGAIWDSTGQLVMISRQTAKFRLPKS